MLLKIFVLQGTSFHASENNRRHTMASVRHILMGSNGDLYFKNYIDYSKNFDVVLKLLLVI